MTTATVTSRGKRDSLLCRPEVSVNYSATDLRTLDTRRYLLLDVCAGDTEYLKGMSASVHKELRGPALQILHIHMAGSQASN